MELKIEDSRFKEAEDLKVNQILIKVTDLEKAFIKDLAKKQGLSMSDLIRIAINEKLKEIEGD